MAMHGRVGASLANGGRNEIRVNNSAGRCLLENWVEERANRDRDPPLDREYDINERAGFLRTGHSGLLTINDTAKVTEKTEIREQYTPPQVDLTRKRGLRSELMEQAFTKAVSDEIRQEKDAQIKAMADDSMKSIFMQDYTKEFTPIQLESTKDHDYVNEQPVTFWSEHKDKIHGVTQTKTRDTVFRKNDAFSKPIGEYWDEAKPTEFDQYPMM